MHHVHPTESELRAEKEADVKKGEKMPDEVRAKISAALRGRRRPPEAVRLQVEARRTPREHGTMRMFQKGGCRCEPCREAHRAYRREVKRGQAARRRR